MCLYSYNSICQKFFGCVNLFCSEKLTAKNKKMKRGSSQAIGVVSKRIRHEPKDSTDLIPSEASTSFVQPSPRTRSLYEQCFEFTHIGAIKYGNCIDCGKNSKGEFNVSYKMTGHCTSSLKAHPDKKHPEFQKIFGAKDVKKNANQTKLKLEEFFKVKKNFLIA